MPGDLLELRGAGDRRAGAGFAGRDARGGAPEGEDGPRDRRSRPPGERQHGGEHRRAHGHEVVALRPVACEHRVLRQPGQHPPAGAGHGGDGVQARNAIERVRRDQAAGGRPRGAHEIPGKGLADPCLRLRGAHQDMVAAVDHDDRRVLGKGTEQPRLEVQEIHRESDEPRQLPVVAANRVGEDRDPAAQGMGRRIARGEARRLHAFVEPPRLAGALDLDRIRVGRADQLAGRVAQAHRHEVGVQPGKLEEDRVAALRVERPHQGPPGDAGEQGLLVGQEDVELRRGIAGQYRHARIGRLPRLDRFLPGLPGEQARGRETYGDPEEEELCAYRQAQGHGSLALHPSEALLWGLQAPAG